MKYEVLLADDHAIIRDGLRLLLSDTEDFTVAGEASNGTQVMEMVRAREWGLLILDLSMQGRNGLELIKLIKAERPRLPIMIFTMHQEEQYAVRAMRAGASGYLTKESDSDLLIPALRKIARGGVYVSPKVAELLAFDVSGISEDLPHKRLSNREYEVFTRLMKGRGLKEIADELSLAITTVSTHKASIHRKLGVTNEVELVRYAMTHQLMED